VNSAVRSAWAKRAWANDFELDYKPLVDTGPDQVWAPQARALLHHRFVEQAVRRSAFPAVISRERSLTYGELDTESTQVACRLARRGVGVGSLVGVVMEKGWEQIVACLGVLRSGGAYVPVDPRWPSKRLHNLLESAEVSQVLTQPQFRDSLDWPKAVSVSQVERLAADAVVGTAPQVAVFPGDLAYVIYTSGSTGIPKGVMIEHGPAVNTVLDVNDELSLTAADRVLALSALNFDLSVYDIFGPLSVGGAVVIPSPGDEREPGNWLRLMADSGVSVWNSVPALMAMLCEHAKSAPLPPTLLGPRAVLLSGDWIPVSLPADIWELFPDTTLWSLGGATEASIWSIWHRITPADASMASIPYGVSMKNQRVFVADAAMRPRPHWVPGEIYIGGAGLARGYLGNAAQTAQSFVVDPATGTRLYRTGDWGRLLPNGEIEFLGREDMQVKIGGHRIELGDVESALLSCAGVRGAVGTVCGDRGKTRLIAHVLLEPGVRQSGLELKKQLEKVLPTYMVPAVIAVRDEFPLTANGKVDRAALSHVSDETATTGDVELPADADEKLLLTIWTRFFDAPALSVTDNFFDLGGDSLKAVRLASVLRREAGVEMPVSALFGSPDIRSLAQRLRELRASAGGRNHRRVVVPIHTEGTAVPLVLAHPVGGDVLCYSELGKRLRDDQPFYALQSRERLEEEPTLEELAADYARAVLRDVPGPRYRLGGWSMGGVLAMELARELEAHGCLIDFVIAIDVLEGPGQLRQPLDGHRGLLSWLGRDLAGLTGLPWFPGDDSAVDSPSALFESLRSQGVLPMDIDPREFDAMFARFASNARALYGYRPKPFDGPVYFLRTESGATSQAAAGWRSVCRGRFDEIVVPGDHYTVLKSANVDAVAARIRSILTGRLA
jgi:amino acid adenylation domain-containing protein